MPIPMPWAALSASVVQAGTASAMTVHTAEVDLQQPAVFELASAHHEAQRRTIFPSSSARSIGIRRYSGAASRAGRGIGRTKHCARFYRRLITSWLDTERRTP